MIGLHNGGEHWHGVQTQSDAIEAHNADVLWYAQTCKLCRAQATQGK